MNQKNSISFVPEKISYTMSTTNSEQHPLPLSIVLHLLPGILTGIVFFALAPFAQKMNFPPFVAHAFADLVILLPVMYGILFYQGFRKNGRPSLDGVILFRERIPRWQYFVYVPIVVVASVIFLLLSPVSDAIREGLFSWWPAMYELSLDLSSYPRSTAIISLVINFLMICLAAPITEEIYFRGYLLPRLSRFGFWAVPIHTALFGLFHTWTPWMAVTRTIGIIPFAYIVQRTKNIYIGIIAHVLFNLVDLIPAVILVLQRT